MHAVVVSFRGLPETIGGAEAFGPQPLLQSAEKAEHRPYRFAHDLRRFRRNVSLLGIVGIEMHSRSVSRRSRGSRRKMLGVNGIAAQASGVHGHWNFFRVIGVALTAALYGSMMVKLAAS